MKTVATVASLGLFAFILQCSWAIAADSPDLPKADSSWSLIDDSDQILVHNKKVEGSDAVAFRGETVIDAPIAKVAGVLYDVVRKKEWVFRIQEAKEIRPISPSERIEYNHTASGFFLVRDRDFVFNAKATLDKAKGQAVFDIRSVEDPAAPPTDRVRGHIHSGKYILTSLANGTKTHTVVEMHIDPKGSVPKWLVNLFQKKWPSRTLDGIRTQSAKADVAEYALVKELFSGKTPKP